MHEVKAFPLSSLAIVERRVSKLLRDFVCEEAPRCCLALVIEEHSIFIPRELRTDPDWNLVFMPYEEGLTGRALKTTEPVYWKKGDRSPFRQGDTRTVHEIGISVQYLGRPSAVILIDYFEGEGSPDAFMKSDIRLDLKALRDQVQAALNSHEAEINRLEAKIDLITQDCVAETKSLRGYTAVKRWDGTLKYITAGDHTYRFKLLNQLEGMCGEALRSGAFQSAANVWNHPSYFSSDDEIKSEAVAPIDGPGATVGVLNMESSRLGNYTPEREAIIKRHARALAAVVQQYRKAIMPPGLGAHGALLSDLIEQFSVQTQDLGLGVKEHEIRTWALDLLVRRVRQLDGVSNVELEPDDSTASPFDEAAPGHDAPPRHSIRTEADGRVSVAFDARIYGVSAPVIRVTFDTHPENATITIVNQLCRLTTNEVRRRVRERRTTEFERLVNDIKQCSLEQLKVRLPERLRSMFNCDHVSLFVPGGSPSRRTLVPWSSTANEVRFPGEPFYRIAVDDGLTGYAATQREVLLIKDAMDAGELAQIHPELRWKHKSAEDDCNSVRSFFAIPIWVSDELVWLLRGHRSVHFRHLPLSETDRERMQRVQFLLASALTAGLPSASEVTGIA